MAKSKVTDKFQVTVPKKVREEIGLEPGEEVTVEASEKGDILIRRQQKIKDPLIFLLGQSPRFKDAISIEDLENKMEEP